MGNLVDEKTLVWQKLVATETVARPGVGGAEKMGDQCVVEKYIPVALQGGKRGPRVGLVKASKEVSCSG